MSIVWCKLPKAGLGNQLFPLLHAAVFAHLNGMPLYVTGYHQIKLGPYLRRERVKRHYAGYFMFQTGWLFERMLQVKLIIQSRVNEVTFEPELLRLKESRKKHIYVFSKLPSSKYYFEKLKPHRSLVKDLLEKMIQPELLSVLKLLPSPVIGVHIRMGDFRKLNPGETYNGGHVRTPESYYTDIISRIRKINPHLPVTVFTDGYENEFEVLFRLPKVKLAMTNPDIVDLLLLSKSKFFIGTYGSTFSYWAAFLSNDTVIMHRFLQHATIRPEEMRKVVYEGPFDENESLLMESIKKLNIETNE